MRQLMSYIIDPPEPGRLRTEQIHDVLLAHCQEVRSPHGLLHFFAPSIGTTV
jgi:hypothetical protein